MEFLRLKNRIVRFSSKGLGLIIAPTLRCNFGCEYCYVGRNAGRMNVDARARLKAFFTRHLLVKGRAAVCWTGGDPSLALEVVRELSAHFIDTCAQKEAGYDSVMITNGYLLGDSMLSTLADCRVRAVQITLDGHRRFHDARRHLAGGAPTYDPVKKSAATARSWSDAPAGGHPPRARSLSAARIDGDGRSLRVT